MCLLCLLWFLLSELFQKPHIILEKQLQVVDVVSQHRITIDSAAECKAGVFVRIVIDEAVQVGMYHAGPHDFDPSRLLANTATGAFAEHTGHVNLSAWLDEWEKARTQSRFRLLAEELLVKSFECAFKVGE